MKVILLGTGTSQGIPVITCQCDTCTSSDKRDCRLRTSAYISVDNVHFAIDIGPDFRQQMLANRIADLDCILLTHTHNDHIIGLDDVRPFNFLKRKSIPVYGTEDSITDIRDRFKYVFAANKYPGAPSIDTFVIDPTKTFTYKGVTITPLEVKHGNLNIVGYRINDFVYITDANHIPENTLQNIFGCKILIINALRKESHHSHFSLNDALSEIEKVKPDKTYITHISHRMGLTKDWEVNLPSNVFPGYDGLEISL